MTKTQKLRNLAEGFLAALVECGYRGPWRWPHHQWEGAFYRVWGDWPARTSEVFPTLTLGGSADGRSSQARAILWQINRASPFAGFELESLTDSPRGLTPREYLEIWCQGATPDQWVELAGAFLAEMSKLDARHPGAGDSGL